MDYVKKFLNVEGIIGQGAFGKVYVSHANESGCNNTRFALKCVHPILRPIRLVNELRHLRDLGGIANVVQMHTAHFNMGSLFIVMDLIEHDRFVEIVAHLELSEIVMYMKNLMIALEHVHKHDIMHRDIKPANFLFNRKTKKFSLVDFGLAQKMKVSKPPTSTLNNSAVNNIKSSITTSTIVKGTPLKSPASHLINMTPTGSPATPNVSTKRHINETADSREVDLQLKKLCLSKPKEQVKLVAGAYESPVTQNDRINRLNWRNSNQFSPVTQNDRIGRPNWYQNHQFSTPTSLPLRRNPDAKCSCRGRAKICQVCAGRQDSNAPKSGTPGFKAPEVLLRHNNQTTAVDMWSAGCIFACLLSGHSPFFRDVDDNTSLAEIITLLGSQRVCSAAKAIGIKLIVAPEKKEIDLKQLCKVIRSSPGKNPIEFPDTLYDLLIKMLDPNPKTRITASEALKHPCLQTNDCG